MSRMQELQLLGTKEQEMQVLGVRLQGALLARGFFQISNGGPPEQIIFSRVYADKNSPLGFIEIDTSRLPQGVPLDKLSTTDTRRFLSAVIGRPITIMNGKGLTYCVKINA